MNHCSQLLQEIHQFTQEHFLEAEEPLICYLRFHIFSKKQPKYLEKILKAMKAAKQTTDREEFFNSTCFFTHLCQIEPFFHNRFNAEMDQLFDTQMVYLKKSQQRDQFKRNLSCTALLLSPSKCVDLLRKISKLTDSIQTDYPQIQFFLKVLNRRLEQEMEKKKLFMITKEQQTDGVIYTILADLNFIKKLNHDNIVVEKAKFINNLLKYFNSQTDKHQTNSDKLKSKILEQKDLVTIEVDQCSQSNLKQQSQSSLLYELINNYLKLYNIQIDVGIVAFLNQSLDDICKISFIKLIQTVLNKMKSSKTFGKQMLNSILKRLHETILTVNQGGVSQKYQVVKSMCNLMIEIFKENTSNFNKEIIKRIKSWHTKPCHQLFLSSLILMYDSKLRKNVYHRLNQESKKVFQYKQYEKDYDNWLYSYGFDEINAEEISCDPEKRDELVPWELQTLRISIELNYYWMKQSGIFPGVIKNLLKYIFYNMYCQQCVQIIKRLTEKLHTQAQNDSDCSLYQPINKLNLTHIVRQFTDANTRIFPTTQSLKSILTAFTILKQYFQFLQIDSLLLFYEIIRLIGNIVITDDRRNEEFFKIAANLMKVSLPQTLEFVDIPQLQNTLDMFSNLISMNLSNHFIGVYIDLIFMSKSRPQIYDHIARHDLQTKVFKQEVHITDWSHKNRLDVLHYIQGKGQFDQIAVNNCWALLNNAIELNQFQFCLTMIKLFDYFGQKIKQKQQESILNRKIYEQYLNQQIANTRTFLQKITDNLKSTILIKETINLLVVSGDFLLYLYDCLKFLHKINQKSSQIHHQNIKNLTYELLKLLTDKKLKPTSHQNEIDKSFKQIWITNYSLSVLLFQIILKQTNPESLEHNKLLLDKYRVLNTVAKHLTPSEIKDYHLLRNELLIEVYISRPHNSSSSSVN